MTRRTQAAACKPCHTTSCTNPDTTPSSTSAAATPPLRTYDTPNASGSVQAVPHDKLQQPGHHAQLQVRRRHATIKNLWHAERKRQRASRATRQAAPTPTPRPAPRPPPPRRQKAQTARLRQAATCMPSNTSREFRLHLTTASPWPSRRGRNMRRRAAGRRSPEFPHKIPPQSTPSPCVPGHSREIGRGYREQCMNSTGPRSRACDWAAGRIRC